MNRLIFTCIILILTGFTTKAQYYAEGVIVKLNPKYLDYRIINDKGITSAEFTYFLNQDGIDLLDKKDKSLLKHTEIRKVFPFLSTNDTLSMSRTGKPVKTPSFWSVFAFDTDLNTNEVSRSLERLAPLVVYAHPNYMIEVQSVPNDEFYNKQHSLDSIGYPDGHINIQDVWSIETGKPHIKVGIYDTGIDSSHPDLNVLTGRSLWKAGPCRGR